MTSIDDQLAEQLERLLVQHASIDVDKAGFSRLDLWIAEEVSNRTLTDKALSRALLKVMAIIDMSAEGRWAAVDYLVEKMDLASEVLANGIETALGATSQSNLRPFDEFSAWQALHHAGGVFAPKHLHGRALKLRKIEPVKWLNLALIAYQNNPEYLIEAVGDMVKEKLIEPSDIETRYRPIQAALGKTSLATFLGRVLAFSTDEAFIIHLSNWAKTRLSIELVSPARNPPSMTTNENPEGILSRIRNFVLPASSFASVRP